MNSNVKVSIIVPIYNVEQYCKRCFESLLSQTLKDIEVLLVNDGSNDSSGRIAKEYSEKYPKLFKYYEKTNGGLSDARNFAMAFAIGEYIAFVDSDDYVASNMFEELYVKAKSQNADIVECEFEYVYDNNKKDKAVHFPTYENIQDCMINCYPNAWNKIYRREWIISLNVFFPKGLWNEDVEFFFKILPFSSNIPITIHKPLYYYYQRKGSIMNNPSIKILDIHKIYSNIYNYYSQHELLQDYKFVIEYKYLRTICCNTLKRMLRIKDKRFRSNVIDDSWKIFYEFCPNWRKNKYLHRPSFINLYLFMMCNPFLKFLKFIIR